MCCTGCSTPYDERATRIAGVTMWSAGSNNAIRRKSKADRWGGNVLCREQQSLPANVQRRSLGSQCGPHDATTSNGERAMRIAGGAMCFAGCDNAIRRTRNAERSGRNVVRKVLQRHPANVQRRSLALLTVTVPVKCSGGPLERKKPPATGQGLSHALLNERSLRAR